MTAIDISPQKDGGVLKEIIKEGVGNDLPSHGSKVTVHYTGTLLDGTKFDSSKDRNEPFEFDLGRRSVIKAWDIGVATMKQGEVAMLTCAPAYAYGKNGSPPKIPPDSTLKFEIEMLGWKGEDLSPNQDGSIERFRLTAGKEFSNPEKGALAKVHLIGKYNGREFDNRELEFPLGEGEIHGVIEGVEIALLHFSDQEKSRLKIKSKYAFGKTGKPEFDIPPDADVEYEVKVHSMEKSPDFWSLQPEEKVEQAQIVKEKGTTYFKNNQFRAAIEMYKRILELLKYQEDFKDDIKKEVDNLSLSAHLNLALCYLKTDQNAEAKQESNEALKLSPQNEKALFRRGQAYLRLASPEMAMKDFQEVLKIQPKNTAAAKEIIVCNNLIKKYLEKEKKLYANMFDKFAEEDKQKEEEELRQQPDVMRGTLGEWGQEERPGGRDATAFEKENPNILMLNANGTGEFQNM